MYFELDNDDKESFYMVNFHSEVLYETFYYQKSYFMYVWLGWPSGLRRHTQGEIP